ncbi:hypothetical protein ACFQ0M_49255 [Kitasatospora aburaviensis]
MPVVHTKDDDENHARWLFYAPLSLPADRGELASIVLYGPVWITTTDGFVHPAPASPANTCGGATQGASSLASSPTSSTSSSTTSEPASPSTTTGTAPRTGSPPCSTRTTSRAPNSPAPRCCMRG